MNKKAQYGLEVVKNVVLGLFILALFVVAIFAGAGAIKNSSIFTAGSQEKNDTTLILNNITSSGATFFGNVPTFISILVIVVIMTFLGLLIYAVYRFAGRGGTSGL